MNLIGGHTIACTLNARFAAHLPRCGVLSLGATRKPSGAADAGSGASWRVARTIVYWGCWKEVARWLQDALSRVLCSFNEYKFTPDLYKQDPPFSC